MVKVGSLLSVASSCRFVFCNFLSEKRPGLPVSPGFEVCWSRKAPVMVVVDYASCGTKRYKAPELSISTQNYKPSVDLWSAGLIILEYAYNFGDRPSKTGSWCQHICNNADDRVRGSDPLIKILKTGMLKMDPKERLDYLRRIETNLLNNHILDNRVITQTRKK